MRNALLCLCVAGVVGPGVPVRADIGATQYIGHGIAPVDAPDIRMVSAKVDIVWGEPGTLSAVFVMNNEAAGSADVQLGFPMSLPERFRHPDDLDFAMTFDGVPIDRAATRQDTPAKDENDAPNATLWFHCRHRFPPGATTVEVKTRLPATTAYHTPYAEDIFYCVQTGAGWKDRIGSEDIAIYFPDPVQPGQIVYCEPASGTVEGDTVRWRFVNFKPVKGDHDIFLRFVEPDVFPILADLRRQAAENPGDTRKELELIKHLLALSSARYTSPAPQEKVGPDEYREILTALRSNARRTRFRALFVRGRDGCYYRRMTKDEAGGNDRFTSLLSTAGYVPRDERTIFFKEGRERLARFLKAHPHDGDAWNVYLLQSTPALSWGVYPFLLDRIKAARWNCPGDPALRLWEEAARLERRREAEHSRSITPTGEQFFAKERQLQDLLEERGIVAPHGGFAVRYPEGGFDYFAQ